MPKVTITTTQVRVVCGNPKCREMSDDAGIEINFFTGDVVFVCPKCGHDSKISLRHEAQPLPRSHIGRA